MKSYVPLHTNTFRDKKFRKLSIETGYLFLSLLGNERITITGIYELDVEDFPIKRKLGSKFDDSLKQLISSGMIQWDEEDEIIWIVNRFKLHPYKSKSVIAGAINELNLLSHPFKKDFIKLYYADLKAYLPLISGYELKHEEKDILTEQQVIDLAKINYSKESIKNFYINRGYPEQRIDEIITKVLPIQK